MNKIFFIIIVVAVMSYAIYHTNKSKRKPGLGTNLNASKRFIR